MPPTRPGTAPSTAGHEPPPPRGTRTGALLRRLTVAEIHAYDHVSGHIASRARIQRVPVLTPGTAGMTLGRVVLIRGGDDRRPNRLVAHELVHVRQWDQLGAVRFLARYLAAYVSGLVRHRSHRTAYRAIPLEREAFEATGAWERSRRA